MHGLYRLNNLCNSEDKRNRFESLELMIVIINLLGVAKATIRDFCRHVSTTYYAQVSEVNLIDILQHVRTYITFRDPKTRSSGVKYRYLSRWKS